MTKPEAARVVAILSAAYPGARWVDGTVEVYESMLADLDYELAQNAIRRLICTSKFLPTISEIREVAADIQIGPRRSGAEAWGDVVRAIRLFGSYQAPAFGDQATAKAVQCLGWRNLCLGDASEASDRARFIELYESLRDQRRADEVASPGLLPPAAETKALPQRVGDLVAMALRKAK